MSESSAIQPKQEHDLPSVLNPTCCQWVIISIVAFTAIALLVSGGVLYHYAILNHAAQFSMMGIGGAIILGGLISIIVQCVCASAPAGGSPPGGASPTMPGTTTTPPVPTLSEMDFAAIVKEKFGPPVQIRTFGVAGSEFFLLPVARLSDEEYQTLFRKGLMYLQSAEKIDEHLGAVLGAVLGNKRVNWEEVFEIIYLHQVEVLANYQTQPSLATDYELVKNGTAPLEHKVVSRLLDLLEPAGYDNFVMEFTKQLEKFELEKTADVEAMKYVQRSIELALCQDQKWVNSPPMIAYLRKTYSELCPTSSIAYFAHDFMVKLFHMSDEIKNKHRLIIGYLLTAIFIKPDAYYNFKEYSLAIRLVILKWISLKGYLALAAELERDRSREIVMDFCQISSNLAYNEPLRRILSGYLFPGIRSNPNWESFGGFVESLLKEADDPSGYRQVFLKTVLEDECFKPFFNYVALYPTEARLQTLLPHWNQDFYNRYAHFFIRDYKPGPTPDPVLTLLCQDPKFKESKEMVEFKANLID